MLVSSFMEASKQTSTAGGPINYPKYFPPLIVQAIRIVRTTENYTFRHWPELSMVLETWRHMNSQWLSWVGTRLPTLPTSLNGFLNPFPVVIIDKAGFDFVSFPSRFQVSSVIAAVSIVYTTPQWQVA
jgi:hypothetical protein